MAQDDRASDMVGQVSRLLEQLVRGPVALSAQSLSPEELLGLGLNIQGEQVSLAQGVELLDAQQIQAGFTGPAEAWVQRLHLFPAIGSTNSWMMDGLANQTLGQPGLGGLVALAECQLAGRGRRGRAWRSPLGSNLALSMGFGLDLPVSELGGVSLVVGMAAVDALDPQGNLGIELKWPNDLLLDGRKLAGILVEAAHKDGLSQICVGIGVNWQIPQEVKALIDQPVAEVTEFAPDLTRNRLAGRLVSKIVAFVQAFEQGGFGPMREQYDNIHAYQGKNCRLIGQKDEIQGVILGVSDAGELRLQTAAGVQHFSSGEVSLRAE